jgi:16S rRNA (cytosine1402-N4)-methyltransferase
MLLGLDADPLELPRTEARLRAAGHGEDVFLTRRSNFAGLHGVLQAIGWSDGADVVLADLGVSSMQIDDPARGFTFGADGPLDMRMNPSRGLSAAQWLERTSVSAIAEALRDDSDEPYAEDIAAALERRRGHLASTHALADTVRAAVAEVASEDEAEQSVRRVFQALRIEVNDEFGALDMFLRRLPECLTSGGRVAILTFHSGEDRRVKQAFRAGLEARLYADIAADVERPDADERRTNPRSSSAKLRWAIRR